MYRWDLAEWLERLAANAKVATVQSLYTMVRNEREISNDAGR